MNINKSLKNYFDILTKRLLILGLDINELIIDHICLRVTSQKEYNKYKDKFKKLSKVYSVKILREREFNLFILREPFKYKNIEIFCLELSEAGGDDKYSLGFQHIEILFTKTQINNLFMNEKIKNMLHHSKSSNEDYIKWDDKTAVKFTTRPIFIKAFLEDFPKIEVLG